MVARLPLCAALLAFASPLLAQPKGVDDAIKRGADFLTQRYKNGLPEGLRGNGIGPPALLARFPAALLLASNQRGASGLGLSSKECTPDDGQFHGPDRG